MGDVRRAKCQRCKRSVSEVGEVSWTGLCVHCSTEAIVSNVGQMIERRGPNFIRWRRAMAACVGGVLIDDAKGQA